ncbi:MAG: hypothetical protein AAFQ07_01820 [Chloroflexota bacterium]
MTVAELLEQAKQLSLVERTELAKKLIDTIQHDAENSVTDPSYVQRGKTGVEIGAYLASLPPVEFVDDHIEDPVEWVKTQRKKRQDKLNSIADSLDEDS